MKTKKTKKTNKGFKYLRSLSKKAKRLKALKKRAGDPDPVIPPLEDKYADEDTPIDPESVPPVDPVVDDVQEELRQLDGFRDWQDENRSSLTYGDY